MLIAAHSWERRQRWVLSICWVPSPPSPSKWVRTFLLMVYHPARKATRVKTHPLLAIWWRACFEGRAKHEVCWTVCAFFFISSVTSPELIPLIWSRTTVHICVCYTPESLGMREFIWEELPPSVLLCSKSIRDCLDWWSKWKGLAHYGEHCS